MTLTLDDLNRMGSRELHDVMLRGHPLDHGALADTQYLGVDLSLPALGRTLLWHTFRKTFHRDPATGALRGWNVRMEQTGIDGPARPMNDRRQHPITFGHYRVRTPERRFPRGWSGSDFLDYTTAGNRWLDPARVGYAPLVAVNEGSSELLLGWEVVKLGPVAVPLPLYWALRLQGPLDEVVPVPRPVGREAFDATARAAGAPR